MIRPYTIKKHRSPTSLVRESLSPEARSADPDAAVIPPHPTSQDDGNFTFREMVRAVQTQGMWAFVRIKRTGPAVLHWWAHRDTPVEDIAEMLGHEFGHLSGKILADDVLEEERADMFGAVGREVLRVLGKRTGRHSWSRPGRQSRKKKAR